MGTYILIGGSKDGKFWSVPDRDAELRFPVYEPTKITDNPGKSVSFKTESYFLEPMATKTTTYWFYRHESLTLDGALVKLLKDYSPNNQIAFDLDVLLDDVQNRITFDNAHIGRFNDELSKRVRDMRQKLLEVIVEIV